MSWDDGDDHTPPSGSEAERSYRNVARALWPDTSDVPDDRRGSFRIIKYIGHGGTGMVYLAFDERLQRHAAIKCLRSYSPAGAARLLREAQALAKLSHPNVVQVFDVGDLANEVYIAVERVDGQTVKDWLNKSAPSWRAVLAVYLQAGKGLAAAHEADIIHRDFKPANVMIDARQQAKVLDFGLARIDAPAKPRRRITEGGACLGTPRYMAPEQHQGGETTAKSDQFSFCVALYEGLFGIHPYGSHSDEPALIYAVCQGKIRGTPRRSQIPRRVRAALLRGLEREPDRRWPSMAHLLAELRPPPFTRRRLRVLLLLAVTVGVAITMSLVRWRDQRIAAAVDQCVQAGQGWAAQTPIGAQEEGWDRRLQVGLLGQRRMPKWQARHEALCQEVSVAPTPEKLAELLTMQQCLDAQRHERRSEATTPRKAAAYAPGDPSFSHRTLERNALPVSPICPNLGRPANHPLWDLVLGEYTRSDLRTSEPLLRLRTLLHDDQYVAALRLLRGSDIIAHLRRISAWGALAAVLIDAASVGRRFGAHWPEARIDGKSADPLFNEAEAAAERAGDPLLLTLARLSRADLALDRMELEEALMHLERARASHEIGAPDLDLEVHRLQVEAEVHGERGDAAAAESSLTRARAIAGTGGMLRNPFLAIEVEMQMANQIDRRDPKNAHDHDRHALDLAVERFGPHHVLTAKVAANAARHAFALGLTAQGVAWSRLAIAGYEASLGVGSLPVEQTEYALAWQLVRAGESAQARQYADRALAHARQLAVPSEVTYALMLRATIAARHGERDLAEALAREAVETFEPAQADAMAYHFLIEVGRRKLEVMHRPPDRLARELTELAAAMARSVVAPFDETVVELQVLRAQVMARQGELGEAWALLAALTDEQVGELRDPIERGEVHMLRAAIADRLGARDEATRATAAAAQILSRLGSDGRARLARLGPRHAARNNDPSEHPFGPGGER